jgi:hypothetical protein
LPGEAQPKVLVLIQVLDASGAANVALTYPRVMPIEQAQADMNEIARRTGWVISNTQTSTNDGGTPDRPSMTSVGFSVANMTSPTPCSLPVEPLIIALKRFPSMSVVFVMRPEFRFLGPRDFGNKYVGIRVRPTGQTYTYEVQVKDSSFDSLGLPVVEPSRSQPRRESRGGATGPTAPLIVSLGVGIAVWLIVRIARSHRPS